MLSSLIAVEPGQVLLDWARSEASKTSEIRAALQASGGLSHVPEEAELVELVIGRHFLLAHFLLNRTEWFAADISRPTLADARTIACFPNIPSRRVHDTVTQRHDLTVPAFDAAHMVGRPILVAKDHSSKLTLIDGYHRCGGFLRDPCAARLPIYIGICPNLERWRWY